MQRHAFHLKFDYRAVIQYLYFEGKTGKEIYSELANVYRSSAPSYAQVKFWVEDEARSGRPLDATDEEMYKNGIWYTLIGEFGWKK